MEEKKEKRSFSKTRSKGEEGPKRETSRGKSSGKERSKRTTGEGDNKPRRSYGDDRPRRSSGDDKPKRSFSSDRPRRDSNDERPKRSFSSDRPRRDSNDERPKRSFSSDRPRRDSNDERPKRSFSSDRPRRDSNDERPKRSFSSDRPRRDSNDKRPKRSFSSDRPRRDSNDERPKRSFSSDRPRRDSNDERPKRSFSSDRPRRDSNDERPKRSFSSDRPRRDSNDERPKRTRRDVTAESSILTEIVEKRKLEGRQSPPKQKILSLEYDELHGPIRLNKYISNAGVCSRREADILIESGSVTVNGEVVTEMGVKILPTDEVRFGDKILQREKPVYLLLNKPKDFITTMEDEKDRKHVMQLVRGACKERIYPVGRLDKNTTGLLLFTNDGDLTKKLTHPKHEVRKVYYAELDKNLSLNDFETIAKGLELEDGEIKVDEIAYVGSTKKEIGITIHSGRNRIVRRIFEHLGYEVEKLDRVIFAGLTKKDLPRGEWRFLTQAEINILKMSVKSK